MMCSINGPELKDKAAVRAFVLRAYKTWQAVKARTPARASDASRKKTTYRGKDLTKKRSAPIDLLNGSEEILEDEFDGVGTSSSAQPAVLEDEDMDAMALAENGDDDEFSWCFADFIPPEGWLMAPDAPEHVTHKVLKKAARIAHRFADNWYIGKFRYISQTGSDKGLKAVYYADDGLLYFHDLAIEEMVPKVNG
ncbi:hypothetical protein CYMTET_21829 [Cymbomonas tetramitiformis]|uniref:Uncharacterized protein n=1 Tax=Cymbomonas tetramitiformis TaxID=36881 RepID=A0AAE0G1L9_9CHLO|nr:hypothetical protein CYMTET_21829 [Cymbomonas tetramitiformis]